MKAAIAADLEYVASYATDERLQRKDGGTVKYLGGEYRVEALHLVFPRAFTTAPMSFPTRFRTFVTINLGGRRTIFLSASRVADFEDAFRVALENDTRRQRLFEFLDMLRDADRVMKLNAEAKGKLFREDLVRDMPLGTLNRNLAWVRDFYINDPALGAYERLRLRDGTEAVHLTTLMTRLSDRKVCAAPFLWYKGRWVLTDH